MDSTSKKRKLSELATNVSSPKKSGSGKNKKKLHPYEFRECSNKVNVETKVGNKGEISKSHGSSCCSRKLTVNRNFSCNESCKLKQQEKYCNETNIYSEGESSGTDVSWTSDNDFLWFCTEYIEDIISYEMRKETNYHLSESFCKKPTFDINPTGREILIDWLISVQVHLKAENNTLHMAVALMDIMLDSIPVPLKELQATASAAFWVAYKFFQGSLSKKTLLRLCRGSVTEDMIDEHEILILQTSRLLQTGGNLSIFYNYVLYKIFGFKYPPEVYYCGWYFLEIMLLQFVFVDCAASEKAVTAVFTALAVFGYPPKFDANLSRFISKKKLYQVSGRLFRYLKFMYTDKASLNNSSVFRKYKSSRYFKISVNQSLRSELLSPCPV